MKVFYITKCDTIFRCDVQWYDVKTYGMSKKDCEHYYEKDHSKTMKFNMDHALIKLQTGSDAAIVSRHYYFSKRMY